MKEGAPISEGSSPDPREAERVEPEPALGMAYAEKPFRDAIANYKESLSEEGKKALEWIASQEAEKALEKYEAEKDKEDPVIRMFRERALAALELPENAKKIEKGDAGREKIDKKWANRCREVLKLFGSNRIERILSDSHLNKPKKLEELKKLGPELAKGIENFVDLNITGSAGVSENGDWGLFISELAKDGGDPEVFLKMIARRKMTPEGSLIVEHFSFFEAARKSFPELAERIDRMMEMNGNGWLWDDRNKKYISI